MEFSAKQIATFIQGEIVGDENATVHTFAKIEEGIPGAISFLSNPKYIPYLYETQSSIVLVNKDFTPEQEVKATMIKVDNAYESLAKLLNLYEQSKPKRTGIDPRAYVAETAKIGKDVYIASFAYVGDHAEVGDNTVIHPHATTPEGYEKIPQIGITLLEDNVEIGANTCVDRATMGATIVHSGVKLDNLVQVAHNDEIGSHTVMAAQVGIAGSTKVGEWCMFGGQVGIAGHIHIGNKVNLGAQSGVPSSIKEGSVLIGTPPMEVKPYFKSQSVFRKLPDMYFELNALRKELDELKKQLNK